MTSPMHCGLAPTVSTLSRSTRSFRISASIIIRTVHTRTLVFPLIWTMADNFLRNTEGKYDLVVYALVDSLIMHSGYANIRLESYLFILQAFADIRRVLKPDGIFVMYNYLRQGTTPPCRPARKPRSALVPAVHGVEGALKAVCDSLILHPSPVARPVPHRPPGLVT